MAHDFAAWRPTRRAALAVTLLGLSGCGFAPSVPREVTLFAAASLAEAITEIGSAWQAATGVTVRSSFAASGAVARQVEAGAPADIVVLADTIWMDRLIERGRIAPETRVDLVGNRLVVIAAADAAIEGDPFDRLTRTDGRLVIGDPDSVPAGVYARTWLQQIGRWDAVRDRLVLASDVRAVRAFVARGEAALGVVYASDAVGAGQVRIVLTPPPPEQPRILYPAALTRPAKPMAAEFLTHLRSAEAMAVFRRHGFDAPTVGSARSV